MFKDKINVAVIGVGYWGKKVATEYRLLSQNDPTVRLYGACDVFDENLIFCREKLEVPYQTKNISDILENPEIAAVHICTPSETHYEICKAALENGKHVTVEKPMTLNSMEALKLVDLAYEQKLVLSVGHIFRFDAALEKIKDMVVQGWFGDLYWMKLTWTALMPPMIGRDIITDLAPHPFDILNFLTNEWPMKITCVATAHRKGQKEETAYITAELPNKMLAHIEVSWLNPERQREVQIMGSKRFARIDCITQKIRAYENDFFDIPIERSNTIGNELSHFVKCVKDGETSHDVLLNKNNGVVGTNVVKLLEICRSAIDCGKTQGVV